MAGSARELRPNGSADSEKITINLGPVNLGHVDLLVREGFYSNRTTDCIPYSDSQTNSSSTATRSAS